MVSIRGYGRASYWHSLWYPPPNTHGNIRGVWPGLVLAKPGSRGEGEGDTPSSVAGRDGAMLCKPWHVSILIPESSSKNLPHGPLIHTESSDVLTQPLELGYVRQIVNQRNEIVSAIVYIF